MVTTTSPVRLPRHRELSPTAAALLTIGGNILVLAIVGLAVAGVGIAAVAVFRCAAAGLALTPVAAGRRRASLRA